MDPIAWRLEPRMGATADGEVQSQVGKSTFLSQGTNWVCKGPEVAGV